MKRLCIRTDLERNYIINLNELTNVLVGTSSLSCSKVPLTPCCTLQAFHAGSNQTRAKHTHRARPRVVRSSFKLCHSCAGPGRLATALFTTALRVGLGQTEARSSTAVCGPTNASILIFIRVQRGYWTYDFDFMIL